MNIPDRPANGDDPIVPPLRNLPQTAENNYLLVKWYQWRLADQSLADNIRSIMEVEALEAEQLARLLDVMERTPGSSLEEKMASPVARDLLKDRALSWLRAQSALIEAASQELDHKAGGNGH